MKGVLGETVAGSAIELARGVGLAETARMAVVLRGRPADRRLDARQRDEREKRRRLYRLTRRSEKLLNALAAGAEDERRKLLLQGLRAGVIGIEDLHVRKEDHEDAVRALRSRYGADAPWCTDAEIAERWEWLRDAGVQDAE